MHRGFWTSLLVMTVAVMPLVAQAGKPHLKRMSATELATFRHDLAHDIPNWEARVNQYRNKLDTSYPWDAVLVKEFNNLDTTITAMQDELRGLERRETLSGDVLLSNSLESLRSKLDDIADSLGEASSMEDSRLWSPATARVATLWEHDANDVRREVDSYSIRFFEHTVATALAADVALAGGCGGVFAGQKRSK